jgi:preprotein translocase subunit SecA
VLDERATVHLTDNGVEPMSPGDPGLFVIPDISEAIGAIEKDEALSPEDRIEKRRVLEAEYAEKSEKLHIIHKLLQAHALYEKDERWCRTDRCHRDELPTYPPAGAGRMACTRR